MFDFDFSPASIAVGFIASSIGFVAFTYGRKMERMPQTIIGLVLMIGTWFVSDPIIASVVTLVLCGVMWGLVKLGY